MKTEKSVAFAHYFREWPFRMPKKKSNIKLGRGDIRPKIAHFKLGTPMPQKPASSLNASKTHQICSNHSEPYSIRLLLMTLVQLCICDPWTPVESWLSKFWPFTLHEMFFPFESFSVIFMQKKTVSLRLM